MPQRTNNSQEYWTKRARQDKIKVIKIGENGINELKKLLKRNLDDVNRQIKEFYEKYGDNPAENLSYSEWQRYKAKLKAKAKANPQDKTLQRLAKQNIPKYRIDRLKALQIDLQIQLTEVTKAQQTGIHKTLEDVAKVSQATTALRFKKNLDIAFDKIASRKMQKIISADWVGSMNWSERLWRDRDVVGKKVTKILETGIPQGKSMQSMARELQHATHSSFFDAFRLIRTEAAHVDGQVLLDSFKQAKKELGYTKYIYDAFLDSRTSKICRDLDGKVFNIDDGEIGVNFPPMHPSCRSTCVLDESSIDENLDDLMREDKDSDKDESNTISNFRKLEKDYQKEIANIEDIKKIETLIKNDASFNQVDLQDIPLNVISNLYITNKKIVNSYPQLKNGFYLKSKVLDADIFASNNKYITAIEINKQFYSNLEHLEKEYKKMVDIGYHPFNTTSNALLAHEYGHSLEYYISQHYNISATQIKKEVLKRAKYSNKDVKEKLSEYALKNPREFFAEAFSEYIDSPKPRKIARILGKYIDEILNN